MQLESETIDDQLIKAKVVIHTIGGKCPAQATGTIKGKFFYFKAHGQSYRLSIGNFGHVVITEPWGKTAFAAGYMSEDDIKHLILKHATDCMRPPAI